MVPVFTTVDERPATAGGTALGGRFGGFLDGLQQTVNVLGQSAETVIRAVDSVKTSTRANDQNRDGATTVAGVDPGKITIDRRTAGNFLLILLAIALVIYLARK